MNAKNTLHTAIVALINLILIWLMIHTAWEGNDKAILVIILIYPILTVLNALIWLVLFIFKRPEARIYKYTTIGLIALFIPALIAASSY